MSFEDLNQAAGAAESAATVLALVVGGYWAYRRFIRQREDYPYITFTADISFIGRQQGWWIVELLTFIENKGKVQHRISRFTFDVHALMSGDPVEISAQYGNQVLFPHEVAKGSFLPKDFDYFFVDPGTTAKYSYIARVPERAGFVMLHSRFLYNEREEHAAERTVRVPVEGALVAPNTAAPADQKASLPGR